MSINLIAAAGYYHQLGMNITCIRGSKDSDSSYKAPVNLDWEDYFSCPQTSEYILAQDWDNATGIGLVLGYGGYRALDIDDISSEIIYGTETINGTKKTLLNEFISDCLSMLKLPSNYPWVVISGSGKGIHIIFKTKDLNGFICKSWAFSPIKEDNTKKFKIFELRWRDSMRYCHNPNGM